MVSLQVRETKEHNTALTIQLQAAIQQHTITQATGTQQLVVQQQAAALAAKASDCVRAESRLAEAQAKLAEVEGLKASEDQQTDALAAECLAKDALVEKATAAADEAAAAAEVAVHELQCTKGTIEELKAAMQGMRETHEAALLDTHHLQQDNRDEQAVGSREGQMASMRLQEAEAVILQRYEPPLCLHACHLCLHACHLCLHHTNTVTLKCSVSVCAAGVRRS